MLSPSFSFVLVFLLLSLLFFYNTYKLWFKTEAYYEEIYASLTSQPSLSIFKGLFLKRLENKKRWILEQKIYSAIGVIAVIAADFLIIKAWMTI